MAGQKEKKKRANPAEKGRRARNLKPFLSFLSILKSVVFKCEPEDSVRQEKRGGKGGKGRNEGQSLCWYLYVRTDTEKGAKQPSGKTLAQEKKEERTAL